MLGLRKEIHRHPFRRRAAVTDHQDLGGAGEHVDPDLAEHLTLCLGDIDVARTDDLIDPRQRRRAVCEGGGGVRAADGYDAVHARELGRREDQRIRVRGHHDEAAHTGDLGGNRVHNHGRRVRRLPARHIHGHTPEPRDALAETGSVGRGLLPGRLRLLFMEGADALMRGLQCFPLFPGHPAGSTAPLFLGNFELAERASAYAVETMRILEHRGVAAGAHFGDDRAHRCLYAAVLRDLVARERRERGIEAGGPGRKPAQLHFPAALANASMSGCSAARLVLSAAWLTIRRAETGVISSTGTKSFALRVFPVDTRSTMASASPTSGASSIDPYSRIRST